MVLKYKSPSPSPGWGELGRAIFGPDFPLGLAETCCTCSIAQLPALPYPALFPFSHGHWTKGTPKYTSVPKSASQSLLPGEHSLRNQVSVGGEKKIVLRSLLCEKILTFEIFCLWSLKRKEKKMTLLEICSVFLLNQTLCSILFPFIY